MSSMADTFPKRYGASMNGSDHVDEVVKQWAAARPDVDASPIHVIGRISRLSRVLEAQLLPVYADHGLGEGEFDVLATLRRADTAGGLSPGELGAATMVTSGTVTKRVDRLLAAGLVQRTPRAEDGRGRVVRLTPRGRAVIDKAVPDHLTNEARMLSGLTAAQRHTLANLLRDLGRSLDAPSSLGVAGGASVNRLA